jgi:thioesterase DpgC
MDGQAHEIIQRLTAAGFGERDAVAWTAAEPRPRAGFAADGAVFSNYWRLGAALLERLPAKPQRNEAEHAAAELIKTAARAARSRFMAAHGEALYDQLTGTRSRFLRLDELLTAAAATVEGLVPRPEAIAIESGLPQRDKDGIEIDQGLFLSAVLGSQRSGEHLCHAMLLPRREALDLLPQFIRDGSLDLGTASVERRGLSAVVTMQNPRFLNAEDQTTIDPMEVCVDLALLDPSVAVGVLRGGAVAHPRHRRVFGAGINLTRIYRGEIPFVWFLQRELGFVHKFYRGLAQLDAPPDDVHGETVEKPWIAAVEAFAIGGHCQYLLAMDYIIAVRDAYMTLPARKEGIIPGVANLRMARFTGDRIARQAIQYERRLDCDSAEGRLICDEVVDVGTMDHAIPRVVERLASSGVVSAAANRRAMRVAQEPLDLFRNYCAVYAREQAYCHFSPALIANLERYWNAPNRKA